MWLPRCVCIIYLEKRLHQDALQERQATGGSTTLWAMFGRETLCTYIVAAQIHPLKAKFFL